MDSLLGNPAFLRDFVRTLCEASDVVEEIKSSGNLSLQKKEDDSPLTRADLASNQILKKKLSELLPEAGWLSEESPDEADRLARSLVWIVDPIDGTRDFVEGRPEYSISVGLSRDGVPILGGVAIPALGIIYAGSKGEGVFAFPDCKNRNNSRQLAEMKKKDGISGSRIFVSRSEWNRGLYETIAKDFTVIPSGSIARKLAVLAAGECDLVVSRYPKNDWDICGGTALVHATGGLVVRMDREEKQVFNRENPLSYGLVAGSQESVKEFLAYLHTKKIGWEKHYL